MSVWVCSGLAGRPAGLWIQQAGLCLTRARWRGVRRTSSVTVSLCPAPRLPQLTPATVQLCRSLLFCGLAGNTSSGTKRPTHRLIETERAAGMETVEVGGISSMPDCKEPSVQSDLNLHKLVEADYVANRVIIALL